MTRSSLVLVLVHVTLLALAGPLAAQGVGIPVFTVDWKGSTVSFPDSFTGTPITEGDLLAAQPLFPAFGPLPTPGIVESAGFFVPDGLNLGGHLGCVGHLGGTPCVVEVDAISHALDEIASCTSSPLTPPPRWAFSVSFRATGDPASPFPPDVFTEALCAEEGADVFLDMGVPCGPWPPVLPGFGNTGYIDGNGLADCTGAYLTPGLGLFETPVGTAPWDNLDGLDDDVPDRFLPSTTCTFFSLDSAFLDPFLSINNSGSAAAHGFQPGDVLRTCPGCAPAVYAPAAMLGLDLGGAGTDDLDALVLHENGVAGYQRSTMPYDWLGGTTDMLFFSVRRGSAVLGTPDFFFGAPIEAGDVLTPAGPLGSPPGIWMPAEALGLATTRSTPGVVSDDVDALDLLHEREPGTPYCFGDGSGTPCPCGNTGATGRGCGNSTHPEGAKLWANGFPSISNDTVRFTVSGMQNTANALLFQGTNALIGVPFGDGLRCAAGTVKRLFIRTALCGNREFGYGVPSDVQISVKGGVTTPGTRVYQVWYRDTNGSFCTPATYNLSNGYQIVWGP